MQIFAKGTNMTKIVILGAGQGFKLDNFNKLLLKHPISKKSVIAIYIDVFGAENLIVGLGYRAISIVHEYPQLNYVINHRWSETKSSETLRMCLDELTHEDEPLIVVPGDAFITESTLLKMLNINSNTICVTQNESIKPDSVMIKANKTDILSIYQGNPNPNDYIVVGAYKIKTAKFMKEIIENSVNQSRMFASEVLLNYMNREKTFHEWSILDITKSIHEIETVEDYLKYKMTLL